MEPVRCKRCLSLVSEINVNREEQVANCERCGALFSLAKIYDTSKEVASKPIHTYKSLKPTIYEMPKGLEVMHLGFELSIDANPSNTLKIFFTIFSLFWNGVIAIFCIGSTVFGKIRDIIIHQSPFNHWINHGLLFPLFIREQKSNFSR
jgi:hypothetical protein